MYHWQFSARLIVKLGDVMFFCADVKADGVIGAQLDAIIRHVDQLRLWDANKHLQPTQVSLEEHVSCVKEKITFSNDDVVWLVRRLAYTRGCLGRGRHRIRTTRADPDEGTLESRKLSFPLLRRSDKIITGTESRFFLLNFQLWTYRVNLGKVKKCANFRAFILV